MPIHIGLFLHGLIGLFHENRPIELRHIGNRHAAGEKEQPLHRAIEARGNAPFRQKLDILHDGFVQKRLADVPVPEGHAGDAQRPHEKTDIEKGLVPAPAAYFVEIQLVEVHIHHPRAHKEHQLDEGVVHHMQARPPDGQGVFFPQKPLHPRAH